MTYTRPVSMSHFFFFFNDTATTEIYTLSLHDALPILEDASYLRLKNIQLGYTFPKKWLVRLGISNLRAYVSADNLLTFTNYFGAYDPEVRETSGASYPQVKTYVLGIDRKSTRLNSSHANISYA